MDQAAIDKIIADLHIASKAAMDLYNKYEQGRVVIAETDAKRLHAMLLEAQSATAMLRATVDAALEKASKR